MNRKGITRRSFLIGSAAAVSALHGASCCTMFDAWAARKAHPLRIAVEFNDHAACAYVGMDRGIYKENGCEVEVYESYITGAALAGALTKGNTSAAYICLIPAIHAYANGGAPIRVVCGTHLYGYGLAVHPETIVSLEDIAKPEVRIGCLREGTSVDAVMHRTIERFGLDAREIVPRVKRMGPAAAVMAASTGQLDAVFLPEHWLTMAESHGFSILLTARDAWPGMIGSVLVVREERIRDTPQMVRNLVRSTKKATEWIRTHPRESARIVARHLSFESERTRLMDLIEGREEYSITPDLVVRSMKNLDYSTAVDAGVVQAMIDNAARLGNIKRSFAAEKILDLRFLG